MGWVGEAVSFTRAHVFLYPTNTSLLQLQSTHKYRRIENIIGAKSPPPNDAQCPGESERGKCRGGWVGAWCAGASCRSNVDPQASWQVRTGPKTRFKRHFFLVNSGISSSCNIGF